MSENIFISSSTKIGKYEEILPQINALITGERNLISNLANVTAALKQVFDFFWIGFYIAEGDELVLGPFQGTIACTRIKKGKGVCGTVFEKGESIIVPNVDEFPGHIACSSLSKSEIVIPILKDGNVIAVLDVDSEKLNDFDVSDEKYLNELCKWLSDIF